MSGNIDFNLKDIVLVLLVIAVIYILFFKKSAENFESTTSANNTAIVNAVNAKYTADIDAIRNLGQIAKKIMNDDSLTLPALTKVKDLDVTERIRVPAPGWISAEGDMFVGANINIGGVIKSKNPAGADGVPARVTGDAKELAITGNLQIDGRPGSYIPNLCIGSTCVSELTLQRMISHKAKAGYGICRNVMTIGSSAFNETYNEELYEGQRGTTGPMFTIFVNRGWRIDLNGETSITRTAKTWSLENKDQNEPKKLVTITGSPLTEGAANATYYVATWVGY